MNPHIRFGKNKPGVYGLPADLIFTEDGIANNGQAHILKMTRKGAYIETHLSLKEGQHIGLIIKDIYEAVYAALKLSARVRPDKGKTHIKTNAIVSSIRVVSKKPFQCRAYVHFQGIMRVSQKLET